MGVVDVLRNLGAIKAAAQRCRRLWCKSTPMWLLRRLRRGSASVTCSPLFGATSPHTKVVYYIPPKGVWAWKKHRIAKLRSHTHRVLTIFPFEVDYFRQNNLPSTVCRQPHYERNALPRHRSAPYPIRPNPTALVCGSHV